MSNDQDFKIKTEVFEGPLDLLLSLIEKRKLLINDISLAKVTDDYIEHIKQQEELSIEKSSNFIVIASTLLLIKSKSLLPTLELTEEESDSIHDLEIRLKIYKRIKEAGIKIEEIFGKNPLYAKREKKFKSEEIVFAPPKNLSLDLVKESILNFTKTLPKVEKTAEVIIKKVISLEETIINLTKRVKSGLEMSFKQFSGHGSNKAEKVDVIISFLAMLELVKQGVIAAKQEAHFEDIKMETTDISTPSY
jgi:segregation and condensation protein A